MECEITSLTIVYSTVYTGTDEIKHQRSASLPFVRAIQRWPLSSPHKGPLTLKMFPFHCVTMGCWLVATMQYLVVVKVLGWNSFHTHFTSPHQKFCSQQSILISYLQYKWHPPSMPVNWITLSSWTDCLRCSAHHSRHHSTEKPYGWPDEALGGDRCKSGRH